MMPTDFFRRRPVDADIGDETRDQFVHDPLTPRTVGRLRFILNGNGGDDKRLRDRVRQCAA